MSAEPLQFDPWTVQVTGADTTHMHLRDGLSPCQMSCRFCPRSFKPWSRRHVSDPRILAGVVASFAAHVHRTPSAKVSIVSADILDFPAIFELLDVAREAGKEVLIGTPGLALADAALVQRLAAYPVRFDLTFLATDDETYRHIVGHPEARRLIEAAMHNLRAAGLRYQVAMVLTSANVGQLDRVALWLAQEHAVPRLYVRVFYPDTTSAPPDYLDQFPDPALFQAALERLAAAEGPRPALVMSNLPLCLLDVDRLDGLELVVVGTTTPNAYHFAAEGPCAACDLRNRCARLHPGWQQRHPPPPLDPERLARNVTRLVAALPPLRPASAQQRRRPTELEGPDAHGAPFRRQAP